MVKNKEAKAVIIGAGIGGISTALFLAGRGYHVEVFEKNSSAGGRCSQIIKEGHRFDLGATMLLMPNIYHDVFDSLGISLQEGKEIVYLENLYDIYFDDGAKLSFTSDRNRMKDQLEKIEQGSYLNSEKYVTRGYRIFKLGMERLIDRNFYSIFEMINLRNIPLLFKIKAFTSHYRYTRRFFKHPHLLMAYTFQNIYVGQSPFNSPALFSMVPAAELREGSFFPASGGMFFIVETLIKSAIEKGVIFHFDTPVVKIKISDGRAEGIILENKTEVAADILVANADLPYVYRDLLPDKKASVHLDNLKYSCSAVCFHWGLDKKYPDLGHHSVFLSDGYRKGLRSIMKDKSISDTPSFYVHAPARTDESAAPPGHETLSVIVAAGHIDRKLKQDWGEIKRRAREAVIKRLKQQGLDDIEEHIKFEISYSPDSWEKICNVSRGSVFGSLSHNIFQMGYFRPHNRHDRYKNLYFTGGSTHPGNGIPNVLISSKLVSDRIIKEHPENNIN
jgi:phytoene desaturase